MYFILQFPQLNEDLLRNTGSCLIINVKLLATDRIKIGLIVASYLRNTLYSEEDTLLSSLYTEKRDLLEYASANICQERKGVKKNLVAFASLGLSTSTSPYFAALREMGQIRWDKSKRLSRIVWDLYPRATLFNPVFIVTSTPVTSNLRRKKKQPWNNLPDNDARKTM